MSGNCATSQARVWEGDSHRIGLSSLVLESKQPFLRFFSYFSFSTNRKDIGKHNIRSKCFLFFFFCEKDCSIWLSDRWFFSSTKLSKSRFQKQWRRSWYRRSSDRFGWSLHEGLSSSLQCRCSPWGHLTKETTWTFTGHEFSVPYVVRSTLKQTWRLKPPKNKAAFS